MGKGSKRRPCLVSKEEEKLRWDYLQGKLNISSEEMQRRVKEVRKRKGLKR